MKLTNFHRSAFVLSVMNDVPKIDYDGQLKNIIDKDMLDRAPPVIKAVLLDKVYRYMLLRNSKISPSQICGSRSSSLHSVAVFDGYEPSEGAKKEAKEICEKAELRAKNRESLYEKVRGSICAFATVKAASDAMPEFASYLPKEVGKTANSMLPALANMTADLIKMGWPKAQVSVAAS